MHPEPNLDDLPRQLLESGVAPKYVARLTLELHDHYSDLEQESRRAGLSPDEAALDAYQRLGGCSAIAGEFARHPELLSWVYTSAWVRAVLRALAEAYVAVASPLRALASGPDTLVRYTAAGAAGAAVTVGLLLSMVNVLSPDGGPLHVARTPRPPIAMHAGARFADASRPQAAPSRNDQRGWRSATEPQDLVVRPQRSAGQLHLADDAASRRGGPRLAFRDVAAMTIESGAPPLAELSPRYAGLSATTLALRTRLPLPFATDAAGAAGDIELRPLVSAPPDYPSAARRLGREGYVLVEYTVTRGGGVDDLEVVESSHDVFERAALDVATRFRFAPLVVSGEPVEVNGVRTTIRFMLEN